MNLSEVELHRLFQYAKALVREDAKAFDLVHTAIVKTLGKNPDSPMSYLHATIRNQFFDEARKAEREVLQETDDDSVVSISPDEKGFEDLYIERDLLTKILQQIEPFEREILFLYAVEDMTFDEIAVALGEKRGTMLSKMHRLRQKIKNKIEVKNEIFS